MVKLLTVLRHGRDLRLFCRLLFKRHVTAAAPYSGEEKLSLHDPVHHQIDLNIRLKWIIDTPFYQRLRGIKQLGATCYVYPSATHSRFEHSLGTAFLTEKMLQSLWTSTARDIHNEKDQSLQLQQLDEMDYLCVAVAGLCHDLGHGPFSHLYDSLFLKRLKSTDKPSDPKLWKHEGRTAEILKVMIEEGWLKNLRLEQKHVDTIIRMITSPPRFEEPWNEEDFILPKEKSYLYEIVANEVTEIDVDRMDYLLRDSFNLGLPGEFEWRRYFDNIKVRPVKERPGSLNQICSRKKEAHNLYDLFHHRMMLHRRAYQNKTTTAVQLMMADALLLANKYVFVRGRGDNYYSLGKAAEDPYAFVRLTDAIQQYILNTPDYEDEDHARSFEQSMKKIKVPLFVVPSPRVNEAKAILRRIECRKLYTCLGDRILLSYKSDRHYVNSILDHFMKDKSKILKGLFENKPVVVSEVENNTDCPSRPVHVYVTYFGYTSKNPDSSPLRNHYVYSKRFPKHRPKQLQSTISRTLPQKFVEKEVYVYFRPELDDKDMRVTRLSKLFKNLKLDKVEVT